MDHHADRLYCSGDSLLCLVCSNYFLITTTEKQWSLQKALCNIRYSCDCMTNGLENMKHYWPPTRSQYLLHDSDETFNLFRGFLLWVIRQVRNWHTSQQYAKYNPTVIPWDLKKTLSAKATKLLTWLLSWLCVENKGNPLPLQVPLYR